MTNAKCNRELAALAKRCGITVREAKKAVNNLISGDGVLYRQLISNRLHAQA